MRVLIVGINHAPETTGIAPYTAGAARLLVEAGHQVQVITGIPHYPHWENLSGFTGLRSSEWLDSIRVHRVRHYIGDGGRGLGRIWQEVSFGLQAVTSAWRGADVVLCVSPALLASAMVVARARAQGIPVGVWVQDLYSNGVKEINESGWQEKVLTAVEGWVLRTATGVLAIHQRFRSHIADVLGVDVTKVAVCRNWSHVGTSEPGTDVAALRQRLFGDAPVVALHTGNMGAKQALENLVDTARAAEQADSPVHIGLVGGGSRREALRAYADGASRIRFVDSLPDEEYKAVLQCADVLLVNEKRGLREMAVPSKLTTYFQQGKPVVAATEHDSSTADEMTASGAGSVVAPESPHDLLDAIERMASDPDTASEHGRRAQDYARDHLSARAARACLAEWLTTLTERRP